MNRGLQIPIIGFDLKVFSNRRTVRDYLNTPPYHYLCAVAKGSLKSKFTIQCVNDTREHKTTPAS